jgi:hypothetical protein
MSSPIAPLAPEEQPRGGCLVLVAPIVMIGLLVAGYGGLLIAGVVGRPAAGERVSLAFQTCPEARPLLEARVAEMGLGEPVWSELPGGYALDATLPADPEVARDIPATLAAPGELAAVFPDGARVALVVESASTRLDASANPRSAVVVAPSARAELAAARAQRPGVAADILLDGRSVLSLAADAEFEGGQLDIPGPDGTLAEAMREVAARSLLLNSGRLPCPASVQLRPRSGP